MIFLRMIAVVEEPSVTLLYHPSILRLMWSRIFFMSHSRIKAFCCHHNINNTEITQEGLSLKLKIRKKADSY
jgi:hypothetical protein